MKTYIVAQTVFECRGGGETTTLSINHAESVEQLILKLTYYAEIKANYEADGETLECSPLEYLRDSMEYLNFTIAELVDGKLIPVDIYATEGGAA